MEVDLADYQNNTPMLMNLEGSGFFSETNNKYNEDHKYKLALY